MSEYSDGVAEYVARGEAMAGAVATRRALMKTKKFDTIAVHGVYDMQAAAVNQGSIIERSRNKNILSRFTSSPREDTDFKKALKK